MRSSVNDDYDDDNCDQREYTHTHILLGAPLFRLSMTSILLLLWILSFAADDEAA